MVRLTLVSPFFFSLGWVADLMVGWPHSFSVFTLSLVCLGRTQTPDGVTMSLGLRSLLVPPCLRVVGLVYCSF